ncbi:MAG: PAS domain S-box protein, partial [Zoogloea sp.]|nr:PAS domain S-box protein [Zoogloea sp.]
MRKLFSTSAGSRPAGAACTGMAAAPLQAGPGCAAHYRHLLERMPVFVAELAAGGEILHLNAAAESMLGWSAAEMRGKSWLSLLLPHGDQTQLPRLHELFAAGREVSGCKSGLRTRDGAPRWLEWNTCNMPGLEGDDVGRICFGTDVTAQVRSEDRLRLQVAALEAAANAIMITDANGTIEWVNHAFSVLTGYSNDEAVGRNPRELVKSAEQGAQTYAELWGTIGAGQVWRGELVNRRKDNTTYHEDMTITPVADGKGVVRHFVAVKQDVTQRKATERELEAHRNYLEALVRRRTMELEISESRARHILESSAAGLFGMDREGRINFVNPAACRMLGYASADLVGKHAHDTFHHSRPDGTPYPHDECPQTAILSAGGSARSDTEVYWRADGSPIFIDYVAQPLIERGEIAGAVVSFIDISERRQALAAREAALREAERLARTRSEFLSNMSHEIRTPLNAILGFARAGCGGDTGRRSRERFEWILDSGELLLGIINDILDLARIDAGKLVMERLPC